mmetsp:Transcript_18652/g.60273  ORF Transcript_18652/g.60273 Transcript_18652/m.60273 type:complete len:207 (-) Transcript_18652:1422-2042(-)
MTYELTPSRLLKFEGAEAAVRLAVTQVGLVPVRAVSRVTGHAAAAAIVLARLGRLHTRFLNDAIRGAAAARWWSASVRLGHGALAELDVGRDVLGSLGPAPIGRPEPSACTVLLCSDASDFAWGGRVLWARPGVFPGDRLPPPARGASLPSTTASAAPAGASSELRGASSSPRSRPASTTRSWTAKSTRRVQATSTRTVAPRTATT